MSWFWTDERDAQLRACAAEGLSARQAGARLGTTRNAILGRAHRLGDVKFDGKAEPRPRKAKERRERLPRAPRVSSVAARNEEMVRLYLAGHTAPEIAAAFGLSTHTVPNILSRLGAKRREEYVFSREKRLQALCNGLSGAMSWADAARSIGCYTGSLQNWRRDEALMSEARAILARARAETAAKAAAAQAVMDATNERVLVLLPPRRQEIARAYLASGHSYTATAEAVGVSRQRVHQVIAAAQQLGLVLPDKRSAPEKRSLSLTDEERERRREVGRRLAARGHERRAAA